MAPGRVPEDMGSLVPLDVLVEERLGLGRLHGLAHGHSIGAQGLFLLVRQRGGDLNLYHHVLVAAAAAVEVWNPLAPQAERGTV